MAILEIFVVFVIAWWMVFFIALPIGNTYEDDPATGLAKSSPKKANLKVKALLTTLVTIIITLIVYFIMVS